VADPRFFTRRGPLTIANICDLTAAVAAPGIDTTSLVTDVAPLGMATSDDLTFLDNTKYLADLADSGAGFCLLREAHAERAPAGMALLFSPNPYKAYALAAQAFYAENKSTAPSAHVAPGAFVDSSAELGDNTRVDAGAVISPGVMVGSNCVIGNGASLSHCLIGDNVRIYPGVRIGQDGFGFAPDPAGHIKVPQLGRVIIEDNVEVGSNTCIDRGSGPDTIIGAGTWIDNLVQIGHNVVLGKGCIIVAQVGISGSTKLGDFVVVGGQAGIAGHLTIGSGAQIAAKSGIIGNIEAGAIVGGYPAQPLRDWHKQSVILARMVKERKSGK
jgi:UDP-3-O-[3-hydroxymyristoyl] glucosamine N-acyltransferase